MRTLRVIVGFAVALALSGTASADDGDKPGGEWRNNTVSGVTQTANVAEKSNGLAVTIRMNGQGGGSLGASGSFDPQVGTGPGWSWSKLATGKSAAGWQAIASPQPVVQWLPEPYRESVITGGAISCETVAPG